MKFVERLKRRSVHGADHVVRVCARVRGAINRARRECRLSRSVRLSRSDANAIFERRPRDNLITQSRVGSSLNVELLFFFFTKTAGFADLARRLVSRASRENREDGTKLGENIG